MADLNKFTIETNKHGNTSGMMFPPSSYGVPHEEWRHGQGEAVMRLHSSKKRFILLEAETGTGKSALAASFGVTPLGVTALTITHSLMAQYGDLYNFAPLYGKQAYPCAAHSNPLANIYINADSCTEKSMPQCPFAHECEYLNAKATCMQSKHRVLTDHYALKRPMWMMEHPTSVLFIDEAHRLPGLVMNAYELVIDEKWLDANELPNLNLSDVTTLRVIQFRQWLNQAISILAENVQELRENGDAKKAGKATKLESTQSHLGMILEGFNRNQEDFVILPYENPQHRKNGTTPNVKEWHIAPLTASPFAKYALGMNMYEKIILSSATIGDPTVLARSLGLRDGEWEHIQVDSQFTPQQMPVLVPRNVPKVSYGMGAAAKESWYDLIYKILTQDRTMSNGSKLALVHTSSKSAASAIMKALKARGIPARDIWIPEEHLSTKEKFDAFKLRTAKNKKLITISWAFHEGLDAPDVFLNVITKVPFGALSSLGKMRKERNPNAYVQDAANLVQQSAGRQRRGSDAHYENVRKIGMGVDIGLDGMERQCWLVDKAGVAFVKKYYTDRFKERITVIDV